MEPADAYGLVLLGVVLGVLVTSVTLLNLRSMARHALSRRPTRVIKGEAEAIGDRVVISIASFDENWRFEFGFGEAYYLARDIDTALNEIDGRTLSGPAPWLRPLKD